MFILILRLIAAVIAAYLMGKLVSLIKLPAILGWLLTGMILGPHALGLVNDTLLDATWYKILSQVLECGVGLLIGKELVFKQLKKSGKKIVITTLIQSLGTFIVVTVCFGVIFYFTGTPLYVAAIFGGIALATAPAPALSIVQEFKTDGPVTKTLVPMAVLDDIVGIVVFFTVITLVTTANTDQSTSLLLSLAMLILLPIAIGVVVGLLGGLVLKKEYSKSITLLITASLVILVSAVGLVFNSYILPQPVLNFMLIGMAFSATFANMVSEERLEQIMDAFMPVLGLSFIIVILNLGAPLDYNLILGAGVFTLVYIVSRGIGKYGGAYIGAKVTKLPETVQKYLGFTLLPHSGVSLVFTGIAASSLMAFDPKSAALVQGTIAAAAVINEVIAVILSKKAFEWAGEFGQLGKVIEE